MMANTNDKLSTVVDKFRELDFIFQSGFDLDVVERGFGSKLVYAISSQNEVMECEALKGLGDLYLHKAKMNIDKVKNFHKACSLYTELLRYYTSNEEKQVVQHRINYAEKCTRLVYVHDQDIVNKHATNSDNTTLVVSMTLHNMEKKTKLKGHGMMPLIAGYTKSLVQAIVGRNKHLEIESLKSLGDLYHEKGRSAKDKTAFMISAGLYQAALGRCEHPDGRETLRHRVEYTEKVKEKECKKAKKQPETVPLQNKKSEDDNRHTFSPVSPQESRDVIGQSSTYKDHMQEGCRALQTGDLDTAERNFAAALKAVHLKDSKAGQHWKESEPLCKLSNVYLKRGMQSKDGGDFTKAAALSNAALVRAKTEHKEGIKHTIQEITQSFVKHVLNIKQTVPIDDIQKHKLMLMETRGNVEKEIKRIEQQIDPYSLDDNDREIREVERKRVEASKALFETIVHQRKMFIAGLVDECMEVMGLPSCKYAMIGLGSQATGLVTPYSDLEFALLIEKETENSVDYFHNLTHYLHLKVINLGETILPSMAIKSLNDFESTDDLDSWFYDSVTLCGFSFDGAMPHACKTPLGRGKMHHLIRTPCDMAKVLEDDVTLYLKKGYHLASVLGNVSLITGDQGLVNEYTTAWNKNGNKIARLIANTLLEENMKTFEQHDPTARMLNVKKEIYRFSSLAVSCLASLCDVQPTTIWETIQEMHKKDAINDENAHHLMVLVSISAELRLRTYMHNRGQVENLSVLSSTLSNEDIGEKTLKNIFYFSNTKQLMRYYYTATPLKKFVLQLSNSKPLVLPVKLPSVLFDNSSRLQADVYESLCNYKQSKTCIEKALQKELSKHGNGVKHPDIHIAGLHTRMGKALQNIGDYTNAVSQHEKSLHMMQRIYGEDTVHPDIASSLHNLGKVWMDLSNHRKALKYLEQAIRMRQHIFGENTAHPDIAGSLSSMGSVLSYLDDNRNAIGYHEQSLQMKKNIHGEGTAHPAIASSLNSLGATWRELGDNGKAVSYYQQALKMWRIIYGEGTAHPNIASSLNNLGNTWGDLGDYRKAVSYHEQAFRMMQIIYGEGTAHRDISASLNNLGKIWGNLGDYRKAISYHEQALLMRQSIHGEGTAHRDIAGSLNNLGSTWRNLGDYVKAISYHEQALEMTQSIHGEGIAHSDIAVSLTNLGRTWSKLGDLKKAVSYHEQALQMRQSIHGEGNAHPDITWSLNDLGITWSDLGNYKKAIRYYEQAVQIGQCIHGEDTAHPDIALSLNSLGIAWRNLGDHRKAISYHEQSLKMTKTIHGEGIAHPDIASLLNNLGTIWGTIGDYRKAVTYHEQALKMRQSIYGKGNAHPDIAGSLTNLGTTWRALGDSRKAIRYHEQALQMMWHIHGEGTAHYDITVSLFNLGIAWRDLRDYRKAISYHEQALRMMRSVYGESATHQHIMLTLYNLSVEYSLLGDKKKAASYYDEATRIKHIIEET